MRSSSSAAFHAFDFGLPVFIDPYQAVDELFDFFGQTVFGPNLFQCVEPLTFGLKTTEGALHTLHSVSIWGLDATGMVEMVM